MPRGSRPGERRGGRQKGAPNKKTAEFIAAAEASGEMPREYLLRIMRDVTKPEELRFAAAKAAAPYCHPHLSPTTLTDPSNTGPSKIVVQFVRAKDGRPDVDSGADLPANLGDNLVPLRKSA